MTTEPEYYIGVLIREISDTAHEWLVDYGIANEGAYQLRAATSLPLEIKLAVGEPASTLFEVCGAIPEMLQMTVWRDGFILVTKDARCDWKAIERVANVQLAALIGRALVIHWETRRWWKLGKLHRTRRERCVYPRFPANVPTPSNAKPMDGIPAAFLRLMGPQQKIPLDAEPGSVKREVRRRSLHSKEQ